MKTLKPLPPPGPPQSGRGVGIPLAVNAGVLLVLNGLPYVVDAGAGMALFLVFFQLFINAILTFIAILDGASQWAIGFLLSGILVLLVGMGMCGQQR